MEATAANESLDRAAAMARTLAVVLIWFFVALGFSVSGALAANRPTLLVAAAISGPVLLFATNTRLGRAAFGGLADLSLAALIAVQTSRVIGVVFVVAWTEGALPAGFALPAGLGDVAIGVAAPFVAAAVAAGKPFAGRLALAWNLLGLADLALAVALGVLHSGSPLGVLATFPTSDAIVHYPLSLVPTVAVPLAIILHLEASRRLRRREDRGRHPGGDRR